MNYLNYLKHRIKHPLETYNLYIPIITFFFTMDKFFLFGGLACLFIVINLKEFKQVLMYKKNYILYIFTIYMTILAYLNENALGLVASFFLLLVTIYTTYVRYKIKKETFEIMMIICGLGSILSLYYTTVNFYTTSTYKLYVFFMLYIDIPFKFKTGLIDNFRSTSTFINPNFYGHISATIALISVYFILDSIKKIRHNWKIYVPKFLFYALILGVNLIGLRLTESRSAFIGLIIGLIFLIISYDFKLLFVIILPSILILYLKSEIILKIFPRIDSIEMVEKTALQRINIYLAAINEIKRNFLFGKGLYTYPLIYAKHGLKYSLHAHNLILEVFLSSGLVGFILLALHFVLPLIRPIEKWIKGDHPYIPLVLGMCALQIGNGFTDAVIVFPQTFILISLIFFSLEIKHETN